jgi:hypothetical protein
MTDMTADKNPKSERNSNSQNKKSETAYGRAQVYTPNVVRKRFRIAQGKLTGQADFTDYKDFFRRVTIDERENDHQLSCVREFDLQMRYS